MADVATTNDLKNGITLNLDGKLWNVVEFQHVKPGKGGAFVRTKLKNVMTGKVVDRTFNAGVEVDVANVDKREMQYLFREGEDFVFMDTQDYDQPRVPAGHRGRRRQLPARGADGDGRVQRRGAAVRGPAGRRGAGGQLHRSRPAGRPLDRRHQAGQAGDRRRDPGAAVHLHRREGQGRHADRPVPRPRLRCLLGSKARKRALDLLFEAELRGEPVIALMEERSARADGGPPVREYAAELVRGVQAHRERIDELLASYAEGWTLDRMPAVDRNILRIGAYELLWADDVPDGVAISEAVHLARELSTDASPSFVNGLLARLLDLKPELTL